MLVKKGKKLSYSNFVSELIKRKADKEVINYLTNHLTSYDYAVITCIYQNNFEKCPKSVGYRQITYNISEQLKITFTSKNNKTENHFIIEFLHESGKLFELSRATLKDNYSNLETRLEKVKWEAIEFVLFVFHWESTTDKVL